MCIKYLAQLCALNWIPPGSRNKSYQYMGKAIFWPTLQSGSCHCWCVGATHAASFKAIGSIRSREDNKNSLYVGPMTFMPTNVGGTGSYERRPWQIKTSLGWLPSSQMLRLHRSLFATINPWGLDLGLDLGSGLSWTINVLLRFRPTQFRDRSQRFYHYHHGCDRLPGGGICCPALVYSSSFQSQAGN